MSQNQNPYAPPGYDPRVSPGGPSGPPQRGGCLTAFLVLMLVVNPLAGLVYFAGSEAIKRVTQGHDWAPPVLGVMCFVNVACAIGVWRFKRWGVYGFVAMAGLSLVINIILGIGPANLVGALIGPVLLIALVRPSWSQFT